MAELRTIYCAKASQEDWARRDRRNSRARNSKLGQRFAEEIRPGIWMCLCCGSKVKVAA